MKAAFSQRFIRQYKVLSPQQKARVDKQIAFLLVNIRYPSLRAKKYDETKDIWQARVDDNNRLYFQIEGDTYKILSVVPHPK